MASASPDDTYALRGSWLLPMVSPPIRGGVVTVRGGRIAAIGTQSDVPARDLGDVAILPAFVNAHTHLEFSELRQPLGGPSTPFPDWIRLVIAFRQARDADPADGERRRFAATQMGLNESAENGVGLIGEIATAGWPQTVWDDPQALSSIVFLELIGLRAERVAELAARAEHHVRSANPLGESNRRARKWRAGVSPHAPYTVHPELVSAVCRLSASERFPVAMHLAETMDELELLDVGRGKLVELLREMDAWDPTAIARGSRPMDYLRLLASAHRSLVIHGNYLNSEEMAFVAGQKRMSVVYCPRTFAHFGHARYPLNEMLACGVNVALGTDSRASNPDLQVFREMQFIASRHADVPPETIVQMGTVHGAAALGASDSGKICVGGPADLALVRMKSATAKDVYAAVLDPNASLIETLK